MRRTDFGLFVTVEGGEGSGKSTLVKKLHHYLTEEEKRPVTKTFEPGGTPFGKHLRSILLHDEETKISSRAELFLFLADRAHHVDTLIRPALDQDMIVLCDRFTDSSVAYQGAARNTPDLERLKSACQFATNDLVPDITFYLDLDPLTGLSRIQGAKDRLEKEHIDFHRRVRAGYLKLAAENKDRIYVLDAALSQEDIFQKAVAKLKEVISPVIR